MIYRQFGGNIWVIKPLKMKPKKLLSILFLFLVFGFIPANASIENATSSENKKNMVVEHGKEKSNPIHLPPQEEKEPYRAGRDNHQPKAKGTHSEEDGKHHDFHMDRLKRIRRFCNILCLLTKCFLAITHICILFSLFKTIVGGH